MTNALLYHGYKHPMQSGKSKTKQWVLEFFNHNNFSKSELMKWTAVSSNHYEVKLFFTTFNDAVRYIDHHNIKVTLVNDGNNDRIKKPKSYADNFCLKAKLY